MRFAIAALFVCVGAAQTQDRVFQFINTKTPAGFQQVANPVRILTEAAQVSVDVAAATLMVQGTADQMAMAEWLFTALDTPAHAGSTDYHVPGSQDMVRVYYLAHSETPQSLQEVLNLVRAQAEIGQGFTCAGPKALILRGTAGQFGVVDYFIDALDKPAGQPSQHSATPAFPIPLGSGQEGRVFFLAHSDTPQQMQEFINMTRSVSDMQRVFPYYALKAVALRGTSDEMALAKWLFDAMDAAAPQTNQHAASAEYAVPPGRGNLNPVVRIFFLAHADTAQSLQEITNVIRSTAEVQRVFPYHALKALTVRSTAEQMALAAWLFDKLDQPPQGAATQDFRVASASDDVARVFYLSHTSTPQGVQELISAIQTTANMKIVFPYYPPKSVVTRGTVEQVAAASRVIQERDR